MPSLTMRNADLYELELSVQRSAGTLYDEGITEEIISYAAFGADQGSSSPALPVASSILDQRLLPPSKMDAWDNFFIKEGQ